MIQKAYISKNRDGIITHVNVLSSKDKKFGDNISIIALDGNFKQRATNCDMCGKSINGSCWVATERTGHSFFKQHNIRKTKRRMEKYYILTGAFCTRKCYNIKKLKE